MSKSDLEYHPAILQRGYLKQWWIIAIGIIIGGLVGLVVGYSLPPVYEATFIIVSNVRIGLTEEITEIMLDAAIYHVGDLAYNNVLVAELVESLDQQGIDLPVEKILDQTDVERRLNSTLLKVRRKDAGEAMQIANTWGMILFDMLKTGYEYALVADSLTDYQTTLEKCLLDEDSEGCGTYCGLPKEELQNEIISLSSDITAARNESLGLYSELTVGEYQEAELPERPAFYEQRSLILVGAGIGFLLAILFLEIWAPRKKVSD